MDRILFQAQNEIFTVTLIQQEDGTYKMCQTRNDGTEAARFMSDVLDKDISLLLRNLKFAYGTLGKYRIIIDGGSLN